MSHQTIMRLLYLGVISVSLFLNNKVNGQELTEKSWNIGIHSNINFSYQQRTTPRNKAIRMRPIPGLDFGVSVSRIWKSNFIQLIPTIGYTRNKTRSSLAHEGLNVTYLFGSIQNRLQAALLYGKRILVNENRHIQWNIGVNYGYGFFKDSFFQDINYTDEEQRLRKYYVCFSTGLGIMKKYKRVNLYWGLQINQGLLSYTKVQISLNQYETDFLSKGSSLNLVFNIHLNRK